PAPSPKVKKQTLRQRIMAESMKLIRVRITNFDPKKQGLPGELFTVANEYLGTVKRFVPYGEATENGWHLPYCIYELLKEKQYLDIQIRKNRLGREEVHTRWVKEFGLEVL